MTDEQKTEALAYLSTEMGIPVTPENLPGLLANFNNFEALYRRLTDGFPHDMPLDPVGTYRP